MSFCKIPTEPDYSGVELVDLAPAVPVAGYAAAVQLADAEAFKRYDDGYMLVAYWDGDRDFEAPQHAGECHLGSAIPGYIDYALYHGASLRVTVEGGRFVFFYVSVN